jgi:hypothetical protein
MLELGRLNMITEASLNALITEEVSEGSRVRKRLERHLEASRG